MASGPKASTFKNQLERHDANTFGSSLNVTLKMRKMWEHSCFFVETCVCKWRGLAQSFIHSRIRSDADSLMRWSRRRLRWGSENWRSL